MKRCRRVNVAYQKGVSTLVLLSMVVGGFLAPLAPALAAETTVDATVSTTSGEHTFLGSASVFVTDQDGYKFYVDSDGRCVYSKTTDGGLSWGAANIVDTQTDCFGISV